MAVPATAQVLTRRPDGGNPWWLGIEGHVVGLRYSHALPGGCQQMSCTLQVPYSDRPPVIAVGRRVEVYAGPACTWDGQLDEPTPTEEGWQVIAHGTGTFGTQYQADYTGHPWGAHSVADAVGNAMGRGLRWGQGAGLDPLPPGAWLGQAPDTGSTKLDALLNLVCNRGGLTWRVDHWPSNLVSVVPLPTTVTRLLVATGPVARTLAGVINALCIRYCSKADGTGATGTPAVFDMVWAVSQALVDEYGRNEEPLDLSDAGVMTAAEARAVGTSLLKRYVQAAFGGPFTVTHGQYLTVTGTPVALPTERAGEVARLLLADWGGTGGAEVTFPVGGYEYDQETGTGQVTPLQTAQSDWASLVAAQTDYRLAKGDPLGIKAGL